MFLRNAWYIAAWDREVGRKLLARTILNQPVVLYRKSDRTPVALEDRCCHRQLPLSMGVLIDDDLRCGYHGLRFDASGACVGIPSQSSIPPQARVRSFPVVERWNWIWIWMGDAARADPDLIPNLWWADHPDWTCSRPDMFTLNCNYRLIADNVLDGTHLTYVHSSSIGTSAIAEVEPKTDREGRLVRVTRWILDRPPPPMYKEAGGFAGNVDRWAIVEHQPPCYSVNFAGCVEVGYGGPQGDRNKSSTKVELVALSMPTPETDKTTHYFFAFSRAFGHNDPAVEKMFSQTMVDVFREDIVILEAQQRMMDRNPDSPQVNIKVDAASIHARRMLDGMTAAEQGA
jgi:phenylpropionate dioxygenase-like ring-hydroxylating dioxygenase large terminal subunit